MVVEGYPTRRSVLPGEEVQLCCSGRSTATVEVARLGADRQVVWRHEAVAFEEQPLAEEPAQHGCGWTPTLTVPVGDDWRSGAYEVCFRPDDGSPERHALFAVRAPAGRRASHLLVLATTTYAAYNDWGGPNLYEDATQVSLQRPWTHGFVARPDEPHGRHGAVGPQPDPDEDRLHDFLARHGLSVRCVEAGFPAWEARFVRWAERAGYAIDVAQSTDLHDDPACLDGYRAYVSVGHDEYWSWEMRDAVEGFVASGGNAAFLSGNTCMWQVRFVDDGATMVSHKYGGPWFDPVVGTHDERRATAMWSDPIIGRPENRMTGVSFLRGGYVRFGHAAPRGSGGYTVWRPDHWSLAGTDLRYGDQLGTSPVVVAYEADGCALELRDGLPHPTGEDGTPLGFEVVATSPAHLWSGLAEPTELPARNQHPPGQPSDLEYASLRLFGDWEPEHREKLAAGNAVLGSFRVDGGGEVFTVGCTDWAHGLEDRADPDVARVTANVLDRFGQ